jgi:poly-gamma-glutamate synthesis protein (capsule biosynthesis protein)
MESTPTTTNRTAARQAHRKKARTQRFVAIAVVAALVIVAGGVAAFVLLGPSVARPDVARAAAHAPLRSLGTSAKAVAASATVVLAEASRPATLTISAVGDMIFDRQVKALIAKSGGAAPLVAVAKHLSSADVTVGNLESPLSNGGTKNEAKDVTFRGDPRGVEGLVNSGFDFLSLANNHVLDYGEVALADTVATLDARGISYAGAGADKDAAWKPAVVERDGATVAFLSFSHILPAGFIATSSHGGLAQGRNNMDAVATAIRSAKNEYDYVIVSFHWGVEYADDANGDQVRDAHTAVDAGADMVLSHHPHVIQAVEYYKGRLIAYSLGDFVFDHYSRKTGEAFILDAKLGPDGVTDVKTTPVYLDSYGKPEFVTGDEASVILKRLKLISAKRSTVVSIDGNTATVTP